MNKIVLAKKQILKIIFENKDKFISIGPEIQDMIETRMGSCLGCYNKTVNAKLDNILSKYNTEVLNKIGEMLNGVIEIYPH